MIYSILLACFFISIGASFFTYRSNNKLFKIIGIITTFIFLIPVIYSLISATIISYTKLTLAGIGLMNFLLIYFGGKNDKKRDSKNNTILDD